MTAIARALVRELAGFAPQAVGEKASERAALCLVDYLSCAFAGRQMDYARQAIVAAGPWVVPNGAPVHATGLRLAPTEAAYVNSLMAASASRTDMHAASTSHPAAVVFPVAFACSAVARVGGPEFVAAVVAGYEAMGRLGRIVVDDAFKKRFRATSVLGTVGGAITASRLLGLTEDQAVNAVSLAANAASGLMTWGHTGDVDLFYQPANTARAALGAALLARQGATSSETILEGPGGFLAAYGGRAQAARLLERANAGWEIELIEYKPVPACVFVQAAAFAARKLVDENRVAAGDVQAVKVRTFDAAIAYPGCDNAGPIEAMQPARMSLQYTVASVLARAQLTDRNFIDIGDADTRRLTPAVSLESSQEFSDAFPRRQGAEVEVRTRSGQTLSARVSEVPRVVPDRVRQRFRESAQALFEPARIQAIEEACVSCASLADLGALAASTMTSHIP